MFHRTQRHRQGPVPMETPTTILIVDDDLEFCRVAADLLTDCGYNVIGQATTAASALTECQRLEPDAVLLDVRLPDCHGVTLAQTLSACGCKPKILLTSTDRQAVGPDQLHQSGATGFVPKTLLARWDLDRFLRV